MLKAKLKNHGSGCRDAAAVQCRRCGNRRAADSYESRQ